MAISPPSCQDFRSKMRELKWSSTERAIARRCFDRALRQELDAAIQTAKQMAAKIQQSSELWELEHHLTELRKEIDRKYEIQVLQARIWLRGSCSGRKTRTRGLARFIRRNAPLHSRARIEICELKSRHSRVSDLVALNLLSSSVGPQAISHLAQRPGFDNNPIRVCSPQSLLLS